MLMRKCAAKCAG